jgi:hypothetical protein
MENSDLPVLNLYLQRKSWKIIPLRHIRGRRKKE